MTEETIAKNVNALVRACKKPRTVKELAAIFEVGERTITHRIDIARLKPFSIKFVIGKSDRQGVRGVVPKTYQVVDA